MEASEDVRLELANHNMPLRVRLKLIPELLGTQEVLLNHLLGSLMESVKTGGHNGETAQGVGVVFCQHILNEIPGVSDLSNTICSSLSSVEQTMPLAFSQWTKSFSLFI
jgi:hypothetical protein